MAGLPSALLQQLAFLRLQGVRALLAAGHASGAWYIGGYVLEMALKAAICKTLQLSDYPESALGGRALKTHVISDLVLLAGLQAELQAKLMDSDFNRNWSTVTDWLPEERYRAARTRQDVVDLIIAYDDPKSGVLTWLTSRW